MATTSNRSQHQYYPPINDRQEQIKFPSNRYFQIHFEHLENQLTETRCAIEMMQAQLAELYRHISLLTSKLPESKDNK